MQQRPKIGFIVEGDSEYHCFPSIINKIISYNPNYPINNTKGNGRIFNKLDEELRLMAQYRKPEVIIVTIDLKDITAAGMADNCISLKEKLQEQADTWLNNNKNTALAQHLPHKIIIVIIDKTFETWLISDLEGLKSCKFIDKDRITEEFSNVDEEVKSPCHWITEKLKSHIDIKNIHHIKHFISVMNIQNAANKSRSLRKFCKEVFLNSETYGIGPSFDM